MTFQVYDAKVYEFFDTTDRLCKECYNKPMPIGLDENGQLVMTCACGKLRKLGRPIKMTVEELQEYDKYNFSHERPNRKTSDMKNHSPRIQIKIFDLIKILRNRTLEKTLEKDWEVLENNVGDRIYRTVLNSEPIALVVSPQMGFRLAMGDYVVVITDSAVYHAVTQIIDTLKEKAPTLEDYLDNLLKGIEDEARS